jgi:hypothetical protein
LSSRPLHLVPLIAVSLLATARPAAADRHHALYLEVGGKGGLWGIGWDVLLGARVGAGVTASYYVIDDEQVLSVSPYLALIHAGPQLVSWTVRSPVPEWDGASSFGVGAELSSGYEYRDHLLFRAFGMVAAGRGRVAPWIGISLGWTW